MGRRTYLESDVGGPDCSHRLFSSLPLPSGLRRRGRRAPLSRPSGVSTLNRDAPVWVRSVSSSRAGFGPLPCRARLRLVRRPVGHESVSSQTQSRPSVSDRTSHTGTGERALPPYIHRTGHTARLLATDQKQVHNPPPRAGISIDSGCHGKRKEARDRGSRCSSS